MGSLHDQCPVAQQVFLSYGGLASYVLNAPRTTLVSQNKEGLVSLIGEASLSPLTPFDIKVTPKDISPYISWVYRLEHSFFRLPRHILEDSNKNYISVHPLLHRQHRLPIWQTQSILTPPQTLILQSNLLVIRLTTWGGRTTKLLLSSSLMRLFGGYFWALVNLLELGVDFLGEWRGNFTDISYPKPLTDTCFQPLRSIYNISSMSRHTIQPSCSDTSSSISSSSLHPCRNQCIRRRRSWKYTLKFGEKIAMELVTPHLPQLPQHLHQYRILLLFLQSGWLEKRGEELRHYWKLLIRMAWCCFCWFVFILSILLPNTFVLLTWWTVFW